MKRTLFQSGALFILVGLIAVRAEEVSNVLNLDSTNLVNVFEVVIAGVVASAVILAILALFIGQWAGKKQETIIKKIHDNIREDEKNIKASVIKVDLNSLRVKQLLTDLEKKSASITSKQHQAWIHVEDLEEMVEDAIECSDELQQTSESINHRMTQIQSYWDHQLKDTADVVERVQSTLEQGLKRVESGLEEMQQNEVKSRFISQKVIEAYQQQSETLVENSSTSTEIRTNLQKAFEESKHLLQQLDQHRETAKASFEQFNHDLESYEEQTYEQFDTAFQTTEIARQELTANVNESRQHIDNLRRYETEGRNIKLQARDHFDTMNSKSIKQFSTTLKNTQQMFAALQSDVQDAQYVIDSLRHQSHAITADQHHEEKRELQAISGDSTLIPFFSSAKK
jgi:DNA repair exonuclease SbcCD ATPase subunit